MAGADLGQDHITKDPTDEFSVTPCRRRDSVVRVHGALGFLFSPVLMTIVMAVGGFGGLFVLRRLATLRFRTMLGVLGLDGGGAVPWFGPLRGGEFSPMGWVRRPPTSSRAPKKASPSLKKRIALARAAADRRALMGTGHDAASADGRDPAMIPIMPPMPSIPSMPHQTSFARPNSRRRPRHPYEFVRDDSFPGGFRKQAWPDQQSPPPLRRQNPCRARPRSRRFRLRLLRPDQPHRRRRPYRSRRSLGRRHRRRRVKRRRSLAISHRSVRADRFRSLGCSRSQCRRRQRRRSLPSRYQPVRPFRCRSRRRPKGAGRRRHRRRSLQSPDSNRFTRFVVAVQNDRKTGVADANAAKTQQSGISRFGRVAVAVP